MVRQTVVTRTSKEDELGRTGVVAGASIASFASRRGRVKILFRIIDYSAGMERYQRYQRYRGAFEFFVRQRECAGEPSEASSNLSRLPHLCCRFLLVLICLIFSVLSTIDTYSDFANETLFWMVSVDLRWN